jgi:hypothetical protein
MKAFHNDVAVKRKYLNRVKAHEKADEIIKGVYWENGKGCAVGCTIHSNQHGSFETELGIPRVLARLEDGIFEDLPNKLAKSWPRRFLSAINPGADLTKVWPQFAVWLLSDEEHGVIKFARTDEQRESIQAVADLYMYQLEGFIIDANDWMQARNEAYAAAAAHVTAAYAAYAADAAAADAAAAAHATAAAYAAYAAAADATDAYAAARQEARVIQSEKLLELLKACKKKGE